MSSRAQVYLLATAILSIAAPAGGQDDEIFGSGQIRGSSLEGIVYALPEGAQRLPSDYSDLPLEGRIYADQLDVPSRSWTSGFPGVTERFEWFAIVYSGRFRVREEGCYTFRLHSDDGSKLFIDGDLVVDNDGVHPPSSSRGERCLNSGSHRIRLEYFQGPRTEIALQFFYARAGAAEQVFPGEAFELGTPRRLQARRLLLLALLLSILGGGALAIQRGLRRPVSPPQATYVAPLVQAVPQKDLGVQRIPSEATMVSKYEIRVKPHTDRGAQTVAADPSLVTKEVRA